LALLDVILGYDCNLWCDYCTITSEMRRRSLSTGRVVAEMRRGRELGYDAVSFTGGEPTLRSDLLGLVRAARSLGYGDVKVQSNGLLYAQATNVDRMIAAGVSRFAVSIHTHDEGAYDRLVQREGSYPLMVTGLDNLVARGVVLQADVILKNDTFAKLPDALRWLHGRGVRNAHLWFISLTDGNRDNVASMPRMTEVVPAMREAFDLGRSLGMDVRSLHVPRCLLGESYVDRALDPGADRVRVVTPEATFELRDSKITPSVHVPACSGCRHEPICPGVRPDYLERYGDAEIAAARHQSPRVAPTRHLPLARGG
jgi:cyclic pyranopterin phosphate synthase